MLEAATNHKGFHLWSAAITVNNEYTASRKKHTQSFWHLLITLRKKLIDLRN